MKRYCLGDCGWHDCHFYSGEKRNTSHTLRTPCPYRNTFKLNEPETVSKEILKARRLEKEWLRWSLKQELKDETM